MQLEVRNRVRIAIVEDAVCHLDVRLIVYGFSYGNLMERLVVVGLVSDDPFHTTVQKVSQ